VDVTVDGREPACGDGTKNVGEEVRFMLRMVNVRATRSSDGMMASRTRRGGRL
jgi:hypothetical protein